jgi:hypothetical protein
MAQLR